MFKLIPITKKDIEWARKLRNTNRQYFINQRTITRKQQEEWFKSVKNFFIIWVGNKRVGTISINDGEIGNVFIIEEYRGQGIFKKATELLGGTRLEIRANNKHALRVYKKLGFKIISYKMAK